MTFFPAADAHALGAGASLLAKESEQASAADRLQKSGPGWLSIYLPRFGLEVWGRGARISTPFAVVEGGKGRLVLCNESAQALGLCRGLSLDAAYALVADLRIIKRDEGVERAALEALADWTTQFTSLVSLAPPQALLLEIGGSVRLFGSLQTLVARLRAGLASLGYSACIACAPTPLAAWLLSCAGLEETLAHEHGLAGRLAGIPIERMPLEEAVLNALRGMGLRTFVDCCRMPRDGLARRVGPQVVTFLDRALGRMPDPRPAHIVAEKFERSLLLPFEVQAVEALLFAAHRLLLELSGILRASSKGVQRLELALLHRAHPPTRISIELATPNRDPEHMQVLLRERLERIRLRAAVEEIALEAHDIVPLSPHNLDFFGRADQSVEDWQRLTERLSARLGDRAVRGLRTMREHRPERAWDLDALCHRGKGKKGKKEGEKGSESISEIDSDPFSPSFFPNRPLWLLQEPDRLKIHDGKPILNGVLHLEERAERIESGWWDGRDVARDYFVARNVTGARFWIFRDRRSPHRWYLHGVFA